MQPDPWEDNRFFCPGCDAEVDEPGLCENCQHEEEDDIPTPIPLEEDMIGFEIEDEDYFFEDD